MKPRLYRLRKWYLDFLTPTQEYCFVYLLEISVLGVAYRSLTIHVADHVRRERITKTIALRKVKEEPQSDTESTFHFKGGHVVIGCDHCSIEVEVPGCVLRLAFDRAGELRSSPFVITGGRKRRILWEPLQPVCNVSGKVSINDKIIDVDRYPGYVDYLESTFLPPVVPARSLYWGRLHHSEIDLVYMRASDRSATSVWSRMIARYDGTPSASTDHVMVRDLSNGESRTASIDLRGYAAEAQLEKAEIHLEVHHTAALQESSFIEHQNVRSAVACAILRKVTRDPRSTKWLSVADIRVRDGEMTREFRGIPLIDEYAML